MVDKTISSLTAASALTGAEIVPVVQSGNSRQTTTQAIADLGTDWWYVPPLASAFPTTFGTVAPTLGDDADVGMMVDGGAPVSGDALRAACKSISTPTADWTVTALINVNVWPDNFSGVGLFIVDNAASRAICFGKANNEILSVQRRSIPTGYTATVKTTNNMGGLLQPVWLRISHDSGSSVYRFYTSGDGKTFAEFTNYSSTAWLTNRADYVGFGAFYSRTTGPNNFMSVPYWAETGL